MCSLNTNTHGRWIIVNIANETQFGLRYENHWFNYGAFYDSPSNIPAFGHSYFSACNTFESMWAWIVSGVAIFFLQVPRELKEHPICIAFSNPRLLPIATRAEFCSDMKSVWLNLGLFPIGRRSTHLYRKDLCLQSSTNGAKVSVILQLKSTPGLQANVTLTQTYYRATCI